jgi:hypothetical protein
MTNINESLRVECPYVRAKDYLMNAVSDASQAGLPGTLELTATLPATKAEFSKRVRVTYAAAIDPMHFDQPWHVHWEPEPGGIYPSFDGQLVVRADDSYRFGILELQGTYTPPLGAAGKLFDAALGHTIAAATAQRLLQNIAADMVDRCKAEEAAKQHASRPV